MVIKNVQSKDTGNIGYKKQSEDKQKQKLEKIERAIKNVQSKDKGNIVYQTQNEDKEKTKQYRKQIL